MTHEPDGEWLLGQGYLEPAAEGEHPAPFGWRSRRTGMNRPRLSGDTASLGSRSTSSQIGLLRR